VAERFDRSCRLISYPLPPLLPGNPYLELLHRPMTALGVVVRLGRPRSELPALLGDGGARVLHLHFFDELTQHRHAAQTIAHTTLFLGMLRVLQACGVRLVWTAHNLAPHESHHPAMAQLAYRAVARTANGVIAHGHAALALLEERYGPLQRAAVIPHGNYIGVYGPRRTRAEGRAALGLAGGRVTLAPGALRPYKGLEDLIDAFAQLPAAMRGTLLIAGAAKNAAYAAQLARHAKTVPGVCLLPRHIPNNEMALFLAAADLVALPYRQTLTSGAAILALSYARPLLVPDTPALRELVRHEQDGLLFATGRLPQALAQALAHPDLDALGERGLAAACMLDWRDIARRTVTEYQAALERAP
jgi:glycosyltransferase involved in cell wall biosynthesis